MALIISGRNEKAMVEDIFQTLANIVPEMLSMHSVALLLIVFAIENTGILKKRIDLGKYSVPVSLHTI